MHKIDWKKMQKIVVDYHRRLHPRLKEVVRKDVIKLLEAGTIYLVADSNWVCSIHCVPKKGGITIVSNENELVARRTAIGYRMCNVYKKFNKATKKHHYPFPFID
jgi:hypothetical protein